MPNHDNPFIDTYLDHICTLAERIGPRGSTTDAERRGSEFCREVLDSLGLAPRVETFLSARSMYYPQIVTGALMVAAFIIYPLAAPITSWIAAGLVLVAIASHSLELSFRANPYRWFLPKASSQNVIATVPPRGEHRQDLILIGHVDTNHTPVVFSSETWIDAFRIVVALSFLALIAQTVLYALGALFGWGWIWPFTLVSVVLGIALIGIGIEAEMTPFSPGANDNATAVGMVLTLARFLKEQPLEHTRVWLACTGCEEVKHYGAADFFRRHCPEMVDPKALIFEMLGCNGPAYLLREGIRPFSFAAHPEMIRLAAQVAEDCPHWGAHPTRVDFGYTEMADADIAGVPAITFIGIGAERIPIGYRGKPMYWHRRDDTFDKIEPEVLERAWGYTCDFIRALDRHAKNG